MKQAALFILGLPLLLAAQEPVYMEAATQPAVGLGYLRTQLLYRELGNGGGLSSADEWLIKTRYTHGIRYNISVTAEASYSLLNPDVEPNKSGFNDPRIFAKWRVLQKDIGPVNTVRGSLIGGVEIPVGDSAFSSDSTDPFGGGVITTILGRHGLNAGALWQFNTGGGPDGSDELTADASWLYRLSPARWKADTKASFYTVLEINSHYWDDGDREMLAAPGLLYEARDWAAEIALHLPLFEEVENRRPEDFGLTVGVRYLF